MLNVINAESQINEFIINTFMFGSSENKISANDSFLENGIIDSTGILELVGFLQNNFNIEIEDHEMLPQNLDSINNILEFLKKKCS